MQRIITHSGKFHADEVVSCALLRLLKPKIEIIRTRDISVIQDDDIVVDFGGIYDPSKYRFDHHQNGAPKRPNGKSYSSAGMVWNSSWAHNLLSKMGITDHLSPIIAAVDVGFISHIDAIDSGEAQIEGYSFSAAVGSFNARNLQDGEDVCFMRALEFAQQVLSNVIEECATRIREAEYVRRADVMFDGKVILLGRGVPWMETVMAESKFDNAEFVMFPHIDGVTWRLQAIPKEMGSFEKRRALPDAWAGHNGQDLEYITGVKGAVFCHKALFICGANSFEAMVDMAELAVQYPHS